MPETAKKPDEPDSITLKGFFENLVNSRQWR